MAVTSFAEIHDGRDGELQMRGLGRTAIRYSRVFRAVTNDNDDDAAIVTVYAECPRQGDPHPTEPACFCQAIRARNESFSKRVWLVTCLYSNETELSENPLNDPADIEWTTEQFTRPYFRDRDTNFILNSAGDPFDPPVEGDDSRWIAVIRKNVECVPIWVLTYRDAVNNNAIIVDGVPVPAGYAKVMGLSISSKQERNDIAYRVLTISLAIDADGWAKTVLDAGYRELDGTTGERKNIHNDGDDELPPSPVPLNGSGAVLTNPTPATAVAKTFNIYKSKDFSILPLS